MIRVVPTRQFKRDYRRLQTGDQDLIDVMIERLARQEPLEPRQRDHALRGLWRGYRECHVRPDLLLIYRVEGEELRLARAGSHAELF